MVSQQTEQLFSGYIERVEVSSVWQERVQASDDLRRYGILATDRPIKEAECSIVEKIEDTPHSVISKEGCSENFTSYEERASMSKGRSGLFLRNVFHLPSSFVSLRVLSAACR